MPEKIMTPESRHALLSPVGYLRALIKGIPLIIAGTLVAALVGVFMALSMPERYSASATLLVSPLPFVSTPDNPMLLPKALTVPDYEVLLKSDGILMRAAEKAATLGSWTETDLERVKRISSLRNMVTMEVKVAQKTVSATQYSPIITLTAEGSTAEHARDLAKAWAEVCEEVSREAFDTSKLGLLNFVSDRFDSTKASVEGVSGRIRDMEIQWNDELSKAELANKHDRLLDYQEKTIDQRIKIETTKKEIADLEAALADEPERIQLYKSPPMTALFLEDVKKGAKGAPDGYISEEVNPVRETLRQKLIEKRSELASMEEFTRQMETQTTQVAQEVQGLREEIALKSYDRKILNLEETTQMRSYDFVAGLVEQAKFVEADQKFEGDLKLLSEPVLPDRKSWPPRTLLVLLACFAGFFVSVAVVLLRQVLNSEELNRA